MVDCSEGAGCCICLLFVPVIFFLGVSPWLAVGGPWVTYTVNTDLINTTKFSDLALQYPMLHFDRQQYLGKLCINRITLELWMAVFHKDPQLTCSSRKNTWGYSSYRSCRFSYCMSDWNVLKNNRTTFSHNVKLFANPSYYLSITDACWWAWWIPAICFIFCDCPSYMPVIYTIVVFALRVALSSASMITFMTGYNQFTDPPYTGYLSNNTNLQRITNWNYDYGFAFGWITVIINVICFLVILIGAIVMFCSSEHKQKMEDQVDGWRTGSRRMMSPLTGRFGKKVVDSGSKSSEPVSNDPDASSDLPYKQLKEDQGVPRADYGASGTSEKQWPPPPPYDPSADR